MAYFSTNRPTTFSTRISARLIAAFSAPNRAYTERSRTRATRKALAVLTDLQLEDIGLTRHDATNF